MTSDESAEFVREREIVLRLGAASSFLIFFQAYLVAPLIPALSRQFHASDRMVGLLVPAYLLPYGFSTLVYGPLSDRIGRRRVLLALAFAMTVGTIGTALAPTLAALLAWRVFAGIASGGIVPIALALIGDLFPYQQRGRAIGWIFGAIAGGVAFGSTLGAFMNPVIGWRMEFLALAVPIAAVAVLMYRHRALLDGPPLLHRPTLADVIGNYASLWRNPRGRNTYTCICLNAIYHSGVFTWLGFYFSTRFGLGDRGIGLALLGYGVPGMLLGPAIGRWADHPPGPAPVGPHRPRPDPPHARVRRGNGCHDAVFRFRHEPSALGGDHHLGRSRAAGTGNGNECVSHIHRVRSRCVALPIAAADRVGWGIGGVRHRRDDCCSGLGPAISQRASPC
jgi:predicted MFS family arabinose efflux permease